MKSFKALLIINPISGTHTKDSIEPLVKKRLSMLGWDIEVRYTTCHGDATRLAGEAVSRGFNAVLAAGGDGTINETAMALRDTPVPLGILPCGSGNGLARHLGIPIDISEALDVISQEHITAADYGMVNRQPFFCTFGVGFDAAVSETFARQKRRGKLSYIRSAINEYVKYHPEVYSIMANGVEITRKAFLVAVCNASQYGNNAYIAPEASITDGLLDITIVQSGSPLLTAKMGLDMMTGYINSNTLITTLRVSNATISRTADGPAHIDGEPVHMDNVMEIECHRQSLRVFTPEHHERFRPLITPVNSLLADLRHSINHLFGL